MAQESGRMTPNSPWTLMARTSFEMTLSVASRWDSKRGGCLERAVGVDALDA